MLKNVLNSIAKNNRKGISNAITRKQWIQEITLAEHKSSSYNPRKARYKSVKGISSLNKEI